MKYHLHVPGNWMLNRCVEGEDDLKRLWNAAASQVWPLIVDWRMYAKVAHK